MTDRLAINVGGLTLRNPIICGSGEHVIRPGGVRAAIDAGVGAVMVKSANENEGARRQLAHTDYALFDSSWNQLAWDGSPPPDASLLNRSGLYPGSWADWLEMTTGLVDTEGDSVVVPSLIPANRDTAVELSAEVVETTRCRAFEVNTGAPHGREATAGAIMLETNAAAIEQQISAIRDVTDDVSLWVKLTGQSEDVTDLVTAAFDGGADAVTVMGRFMAFLPDLETQTPTMNTMAAYGGGWALPLTCRWLALSRKAVGPAQSLIATNGARNGLDVARFLLAGASAVQMTSAVLAGGFDVLSQAVAELDDYLDQHDDTASAVVGRAADRLEGYTDQPADPFHWEQFVPQVSRSVIE
ncbi:MAG: dihydroorotate dehydrogenase (NAD+) catalytic subunit [Acidimicrobiales bacterium]